MISVGTVLLAPIAMPIAAAIWRRRGHRLPVVGHWIAALCGAAMIAIFGTIGWIGGMLLGFAATGRWPGTGPTASGSDAFRNA